MECFVINVLLLFVLGVFNDTCEAKSENRLKIHLKAM